MSRTTISDSLRLELYSNIVQGLNSGDELKQTLQWLEDLRAHPTILSEKVTFSQIMKKLYGTDDVNDHRIQNFFVCVKTILHEREIKEWTQPLMMHQKEEICGLIIKKIKNSFYCLLQALEEPGIIGTYQIGVTVQTDVLSDTNSLRNQQYLKFFENLSDKKVLFDVILSDEGGRFFKDKKRYLGILVTEDWLKDEDYGYRWVSVATIKKLIAIPNTVNIFARTLFAILL